MVNERHILELKRNDYVLGTFIFEADDVNITKAREILQKTATDLKLLSHGIKRVK